MNGSSCLVVLQGEDLVEQWEGENALRGVPRNLREYQRALKQGLWFLAGAGGLSLALEIRHRPRLA